MNIEDYDELPKADPPVKVIRRTIPGLTVIERFNREDPSLIQGEIDRTLSHLDPEVIDRFKRQYERE